MSDTVTVRVHLEAWIDGEPIEVDGSPVEFEIPREHAMAEGELVENRTHLSDLLHEHDDAPSVVQKWQGPFYVEVVE